MTQEYIDKLLDALNKRIYLNRQLPALHEALDEILREN